MSTIIAQKNDNQESVTEVVTVTQASLIIYSGNANAFVTEPGGDKIRLNDTVYQARQAGDYTIEIQGTCGYGTVCIADMLLGAESCANAFHVNLCDLPAILAGLTTVARTFEYCDATTNTYHIRTFDDAGATIDDIDTGVACQVDNSGGGGGTGTTGPIVIDSSTPINVNVTNSTILPDVEYVPNEATGFYDQVTNLFIDGQLVESTTEQTNYPLADDLPDFEQRRVCDPTTNTIHIQNVATDPQGNEFITSDVDTGESCTNENVYWLHDECFLDPSTVDRVVNEFVSLSADGSQLVIGNFLDSGETVTISAPNGGLQYDPDTGFIASVVGPINFSYSNPVEAQNFIFSSLGSLLVIDSLVGINQNLTLSVTAPSTVINGEYQLITPNAKLGISHTGFIDNFTFNLAFLNSDDDALLLGDPQSEIAGSGEDGIFKVRHFSDGSLIALDASGSLIDIGGAIPSFWQTTPCPVGNTYFVRDECYKVEGVSETIINELISSNFEGTEIVIGNWYNTGSTVTITADNGGLSFDPLRGLLSETAGTINFVLDNPIEDVELRVDSVSNSILFLADFDGFVDIEATAPLVSFGTTGNLGITNEGTGITYSNSLSSFSFRITAGSSPGFSFLMTFPTVAIEGDGEDEHFTVRYFSDGSSIGLTSSGQLVDISAGIPSEWIEDDQCGCNCEDDAPVVETPDSFQLVALEPICASIDGNENREVIPAVMFNQTLSSHAGVMYLNRDGTMINGVVTQVSDCDCPCVDCEEDLDSDGIPDYRDTDIGDTNVSLDTDGDGISDADEGDFDSDGDFVPDSLESNTFDIDGDGVPNAFDDDDTDGPSSSDIDSDGVEDQYEGQLFDSDSDGIPDSLESNILDSDSDGVFDAFDPN